jgi:cytochrome c553
MGLTIAPGVANRLKKLGLADVDTYQSQVGEVGNAALHAALKEPNHCGFISALEGFKSVGNRCEVLQFPQEPIGIRIIEVPEDAQRTLLRDATSGFVAYVPKGSIKRGELLAKTGDAGRTLPCAACHGAGLRGMGDLFPPLAGRSPSATARQLYDFKSGARDGRNALAMKPVVANLTDRDIVDLTAYIASLQPGR